ncbi:MAG: hypothetical protein ABI835_11745, partial [Chloroflexota bacterium]
MRNHFRWLIVVILVTAFAVWVILPDNHGIHADTNGDGTVDLNLNIEQNLGLDLVGGLRVLLAAELPPGSFTVTDMQQAANNVAKRVNALGVTEPSVQVIGADRILVELPGETNPEEAISTIQQTALLEFVDFSGMTSQISEFTGQKILTSQQAEIEASRGELVIGDRRVNPQTGQPFTTVITGAGLQSAAAQLSQNTRYVIAFQLTADGAAAFGPFTADHIGEPLAIVLDGTVLSAPRINSRLD